jgi:hypothetical protein
LEELQWFGFQKVLTQEFVGNVCLILSSNNL